RRDARRRDLLEDVIEEALLADRLAGQVDRPAQLGGARAHLSRQAREGVADHPAVDRVDRAVALGRGDERAGEGDLSLLVDHPDEDLRELGPIRSRGERPDLLAEEMET